MGQGKDDYNLVMSDTGGTFDRPLIIGEGILFICSYADQI